MLKHFRENNKIPDVNEINRHDLTHTSVYTHSNLYSESAETVYNKTHNWAARLITERVTGSVGLCPKRKKCQKS